MDVRLVGPLGLLLLVVSAALSAEPVQDGRRAVSAKSLTPSEIMSQGSHQLVLRAGAFDPLTERLVFDKLELEEQSFSVNGVVQFHDTPQASLLTELGVRVLDYLPHNAYVVRWTPAQAEAVKALPEVRFVGAFQSAWKVAPALWRAQTKREAKARIEVMGVRGDDPQALAAALQKLSSGAEIIAADAPSGMPIVRARLVEAVPGAVASQLARLDNVLWIDRYYQLRVSNRDSVGPIQNNTPSGGTIPTATPIWDQDIIGTGQIIAVADTGLDRNAPQFSRYDHDSNGSALLRYTDAQFLAADEVGTLEPFNKVIGYFVQPGAAPYDTDEQCGGVSASYHGTHASGTVAGDGLPTASATEPNYTDGDGMAPHAQILFQDMGNDVPACLSGRGGYPMFTQARNAGAGISSNSYGFVFPDPADDGYIGFDFEADAASYDLEDLLLVFAAGNAGSAGPGNIDHPGQGKSVLAVAATEHGDNLAIASFSSVGPAHDGRIKPDIGAPGVGIRSVFGNDNNDIPPPALPGNPILPKSGTSFSTPTVAGGAVLMRQYFMDGFYPSGVRNPDDRFKPTGALMKATLLNGTQTYNDTPADSSGWGRLWLNNNLYFAGDDRHVRVWDRPNGAGFGSGASESFTVNVVEGQEFRATLVWTDPPANSFSGPALINDLDLVVMDASGTTYRGNVFNLGRSSAGGSPDRINTVEQIRLPEPEAGEYTVQVNAVSVPGNGVQNTNRQGYALVVSGGQCDSGVSSAANLSVVAGDQGVQIDFDPLTGAEGYQIYRGLGSCAGAGSDGFRYIGSGSQPGYEDLTTQGGFEYAYQVRGVDACGEGPISDCQSFVSTAACTLIPEFDPTTVTIDAVGGGQCGANLSWQAGQVECPGTELTYNLYRSTDPFFSATPATLLASGIAGTGYTDVSVEPLTTYYYAVKAEDNGGFGLGPNSGNESGVLVTNRFTTLADTTSPGDFADDPDAVSFVDLESPWQITAVRASTGQLSYHNARDGETHPNLTCAHLTTTPLDIQAGNSVLSYDAWFNLEADWDGVVVEISRDGGQSWQDLPPAGGYPGDFNMTAPEGTPVNQCGFPPEQGAFNGEHEFFESYTTDLSAFAGETVQIRWTFSSDPALEFEGFYLDNIQVNDASVPDACLASGVSNAVSGPWFNTEQSGHGWLIERLENDLVNAYWYVYNDGAPVWLIGTGPVSGSQAELDVFITSGPDFLPDYDPLDLSATPWGTLTFDFDSDISGTASWQPVIDGFEAGSLAMTQIAPVNNGSQSCLSGTYFNPDQNGHGMVAQVVTTMGVDNLILVWYIYQDGEQVWLFGQAPLVDGASELSMLIFSGADFPPDFDPANVIADPWGTINIQFTGNDSAEASWTSTIAGYPDGSIDLTRLTRLNGHICP